MVKKAEIVVAMRRVEGGRVLPGRRLSDHPFRKVEHAIHVLPRLAEAEGTHVSNVAIFCNGSVIVDPIIMQ